MQGQENQIIKEIENGQTARKDNTEARGRFRERILTETKDIVKI